MHNILSLFIIRSRPLRLLSRASGLVTRISYLNIGYQFILNLIHLIYTMSQSMAHIDENLPEIMPEYSPDVASSTLPEVMFSSLPGTETTLLSDTEPPPSPQQKKLKRRKFVATLFSFKKPLKFKMVIFGIKYTHGPEITTP
jgi:hypothetical protein